MIAMQCVHIIDPDFHRRAGITLDLYDRGMRAESYETIAAFVRAKPEGGVVLFGDFFGDGGAAALFAAFAAAAIAPKPVAAYAEKPLIETVVDAMRAGTCDYISLPFSAASLDRALARLEQQLMQAVRLDGRDIAARKAVQELTAREIDVLRQVVRGSTNKEIGRELGISPRTVEIHRSNLMRKLQARSLSEVVRTAIHAGIDAALVPSLRVAA